MEFEGHLSFVADRLTMFSRHYDDLIDAIKTRLQLRHTSEEGLFDLPITAPMVPLIADRVTSATTYDEFVDLVFDNLESLLDRTLAGVQQYISEEAKPAALALLDALRTDFEPLQFDGGVGALLHAVRTAATELAVEFERLAAWFVRADTSATEPFLLEDAIQIAEDTVRASGIDFAAEATSPVDSGLQIQQGRLLAAFVDIFFILFDNVAKHAGTATPRASVNFEVTDDRVVVVVANSIATGTRRPATESRIDKIREAIQRGDAAPIGQEGGTGLLKLRTLLEHDLGGTSDLHFEFVEDQTFLVRFSLRIRELR
jgi:hypothetical protein